MRSVHHSAFRPRRRPLIRPSGLDATLHNPRQQHDKAVWIAESVQRIVKRLAGHSLRAGFVTSAAAAGARVDEIVDHTGHTRVDTLMRYIRNAKEIRTSAAAKLGL